ncbi:MAG: MucBP domain-containing protein, partial [Oscillospiraceae bacterium]|nr:MucBP domain-containing protein [Oscillospiraceae bacterium]
MANNVRKYGKKFLSLLLVLVMCLSMVQIVAAAPGYGGYGGYNPWNPGWGGNWDNDDDDFTISKPEGEVDFKVYLLYSNEIPGNIQQSFAYDLFGPSGDNKPYTTVTVDIDGLLAEDGVKVQEKSSGHWYISHQTCDGLSVEELWDLTLKHMDAEGQAFFSSYFKNNYIGYVVKVEGDGGHIDGIYKVDPAYLTEVYIENSLETSMFDSTAQSFSDVLSWFETYANIAWDDDYRYGEFDFGDSRFSITMENKSAFRDGDLVFTEKTDDFFVASLYYVLADITPELPAEPVDFEPIVTVSKSADKDSYMVGETITWTITVSNDSDHPAYNVVVRDEMVSLQETIQMLNPGQSQSFTVSAEAKEAGSLSNVVVTTWEDGDEIDDNDEPDEVRYTNDEEIVTVNEPEPDPVYYNLTVHYVDESGAAVAESDYSQGLPEGTPYSTSPKPVNDYNEGVWDSSSDAASGTMDSDKVVVYVYSVKEVPPVDPPVNPEPDPVYYTLTVNYVDESGAPVADSDVTQGLEEGSAYATAPKAVEGYNEGVWDSSSNAVSGTMDSDKVVTYVYSVKEQPPVDPPVNPEPDPVYYTLTVNYVDESGAPVAD